MNKLKIGIIGPGSIGLLLSSLLQRSGMEVNIIDYKKERAGALNKSGIILEDEQKFEIKMPVLFGYENLNIFDILIICVKAYDTKDVAQSLEKSDYNGPVLTLQNGYGNVESISSIYSRGDIYAGITSEGANMVSPGHVRHAGKGKTIFGKAVSRDAEKNISDDILKILNNAGFDAEITDNVEPVIWSKLLINVGINALTAIFNVQNGKLIEIEPARKIMHDLVNEAWELVQYMEIKLPYRNPIEKVEDVCRMTGKNYSSMNRDINAGRETEIDYINGAIVREGKKMGLFCPYNETITGIIKGLEKIK